jgi:tetratricopeptide (TPR) repeat protein
MNAPLAEWLKENGPLQEVLALLEKAKAAEKNTLGAALTLYETALANAGDSSDPQLKEADEHYHTLAAAAKAEWDAALALAEQKKYKACVEALQKLASVYGGHETARNAEKKIQEIRSNSEIQKMLAQEKSAAEAEQALAHALDKAQAKDYPAAAELLKQVVAKFPETPAGVKAAGQLKALADDPKISAAIETAAAGRECRGLLSKASNYYQNGMSEKALECINQILEKFPKSTWAQDAEKLKAEWNVR